MQALKPDVEPGLPQEDELSLERVRDEMKAQQRVREVLIKKNKILMARNIPNHLKSYV